MNAELNPNHPMTQFAREQWHKVAAIMLTKFGVESVTITVEDIERFNREHPQAAVVFHGHVDSIEIRLTDFDTAADLARAEAGGT